MPGQRNWILLLIAGALAVLFGVGTTFAGHRLTIGLVAFGLVLLILGAVQANVSRRFVTESMRNAADDLRDTADD
jgi:hypothetical protein